MPARSTESVEKLPDPKPCWGLTAAQAGQLPVQALDLFEGESSLF